MSTISLRLSESLHGHMRELAKCEGISINQFVATTLAEKLSALMAREYPEARAKRGSQRRSDRALSKVADVEPDEYDTP